MNCSQCNASITGNFCSQCGKPMQIARVDWHYILHEIQHVLHLEKGVPYTVKELLLTPGSSVHSFIRTDRSRLVKPVLFLVIASLIYSTIDHLFHFEQGYMDFQYVKDAPISSWIQGHYGYSNIIMGVFISFWLKRIYKSHDYNFFEILILLCFVMGIGMLILAVFAVFEGLTGLHSMKVAGATGLAYSCWAIGNFFDKKRVASYLKALASYIIGMITFAICVIGLEVIVYFIRR